MDFVNTLHLGASRVLDQAPLRRARSTFLQRSHSPSKPRRRASPGIGCRANAKGTPATKGERESAPTHLPEEEAVVEIVQAEAEATRTSANDRTGAVATRVVAVTGISASARRDVVPDRRDRDEECTWPMARGSNQLWRAMCRLHLPRSRLGLYFHDRGRNRD